MQSNNNFRVLFWLCQNRIKDGKAPIWARVTVKGRRVEISTQMSISPYEWDSQNQVAKDPSKDAQAVNAGLSRIRVKIENACLRLEAKEKELTADNFRIEYSGSKEKARMLLEIIQQHNDDMKKLIGTDYNIGTWRKYHRMYTLVKGFVKWKYKRNDIDVTSIKHAFVTDFEFYLKVEKKINPATNPKYIKNLQKVVRLCVANEWLIRDPFIGYKLKLKKSERGYLTKAEVQAIQEKHFHIDRLEQVKDVFLFSCYTGLSYIDIFNLTTNNISIGMDGKKWIFTHRQKTETASRIPLLPLALEIIERYSENPMVLNSEKLLPIPSNQKVNAYLKEIADCCGIKKLLTFHMARHTFATTITLNNGVPLESVSKMMGHTKIQTTQIYARILDEKVSHDMDQLRNKFEARSSMEIIKIGG